VCVRWAHVIQSDLHEFTVVFDFSLSHLSLPLPQGNQLGKLRAELEEERAEQLNYRHKARAALQQAKDQLGTVNQLEAEVVRLNGELEEAHHKEAHLNAFILELQSHQVMTSSLTEELQEAERGSAQLGEQLRTATLQAERVREETSAAQRDLREQLATAQQQHVDTLQRLDREQQEKNAAQRAELERVGEELRIQLAEQQRCNTQLEQRLAAAEAVLQSTTAQQQEQHPHQHQHKQVPASQDLHAAVLLSTLPVGGSADSSAASGTSGGSSSPERCTDTPSSSGPLSRSSSSTSLTSLECTGARTTAEGGEPLPPMLHYAQVQATQAQALSQSRRQVQQLTKLLQESEETMRLIKLQEHALKENIRDLERSKMRENEDLEYVICMLSGVAVVFSVCHCVTVSLCHCHGLSHFGIVLALYSSLVTPNSNLPTCACTRTPLHFCVHALANQPTHSRPLASKTPSVRVYFMHTLHNPTHLPIRNTHTHSMHTHTHTHTHTHSYNTHTHTL
jgi:hypothetical protein